MPPTTTRAFGDKPVATAGAGLKAAAGNEIGAAIGAAKTAGVWQAVLFSMNEDDLRTGKFDLPMTARITGLTKALAINMFPSCVRWTPSVKASRLGLGPPTAKKASEQHSQPAAAAA
jgi:hypothetical protein